MVTVANPPESTIRPNATHNAVRFIACSCLQLHEDNSTRSLVCKRIVEQLGLFTLAARLK